MSGLVKASVSKRRFNLADYGGLDAGATAMFDALQRIAGEATTPSIEIDIGDSAYTLNQDWTLPTGRNVTIQGCGSINFAGGSLLRTVHDKYAALHGFSGTGAFSAFKFNAAPSGTATKDYQLDRLRFSMNSGVWAVQLNGAREGVITRCDFRSGKGIYRTLSNICYIDKSLFLGLEHAIFDEGAGSGFSCGMNIRDSEVLGCVRSIVVSECDDGEINGCTIDYNDEGIYLLGQDGFKITGGYIGTRTAQAVTPNVAIGGVTPAIVIKAGPSAAVSEKISIIGAHLTGHHLTNLQYDNIYIENARNVTIADSKLTFYTRSAVRYGAGVVYLDIHSNQALNRNGTGVNAFEAISTDDSSNRIRENVVNPGQKIVATFAKISRNVGYATEAQGQAFAGAGATNFTFAHGLSYTPESGEISFTPMNAETAQKTPFLAGQDATNIVVNIFGPSAVGTLSIGWAVRRK